MEKDEVKFRIQRYKQGDKKPHCEEFTVDYDKNTSVLIALQDIRRDKDPSLMLRHSCHHASCGACGMEINGKERLACITAVKDVLKEPIVVKPLPNIPVISDLVVDMVPFYDKYNVPEMPYIRKSDYIENADPPENIEDYLRFESCVECGICYSACPITSTSSKYIGPAALAAAWRVVEKDVEGKVEKALEFVDSEDGCWRCSVAYECSEVCPLGVDPAGAIMSLRKKLIKKKVFRFLSFGKGGS